jgi:hypothetical protein
MRDTRPWFHLLVQNMLGDELRVARFDRTGNLTCVDERQLQCLHPGQGVRVILSKSTLLCSRKENRRSDVQRAHPRQTHADRNRPDHTSRRRFATSNRPPHCSKAFSVHVCLDGMTLSSSSPGS